MEPISAEDWKRAEGIKADILVKNRARIKEIMKLQVEWAIKLKNREVDADTFQMQLLNYRNEIAEIKKRNFQLVREWIKVDEAYRRQHPEQFAKPTIEELKDRLKAQNIEVESWRLA